MPYLYCNLYYCIHCLVIIVYIYVYFIEILLFSPAFFYNEHLHNLQKYSNHCNVSLHTIPPSLWAIAPIVPQSASTSNSGVVKVNLPAFPPHYCQPLRPTPPRTLPLSREREMLIKV